MPGLVLLATLACGSEANLRFAKAVQFPGPREVVVIAEGDLEPRSIGSYALRVYSGRSNEFPIDEFILGVVRPRNGIVECVRFDDVDGDDRSEILVIICSVGSGGYFSSDAFRYGARSLELITSVADLDKVAEPIRALRDKFKVTAESKSSTPSEMRE